jgi:hypothetical protein
MKESEAHVHNQMFSRSYTFGRGFRDGVEGKANTTMSKDEDYLEGYYAGARARKAASARFIKKLQKEMK